MFRTIFAALTVLLLASAVCAQQRNSSASNPARNAHADEDAPLFNDFRGVRIGMSATEARTKLGKPQSSADDQDFFIINEHETVQVAYDTTQKVTAVSIDFMDGSSDAPTARAVLGQEVPPKADGSAYQMIRYPHAGFWVSYSRTAGSTPIVTVTMQKIN
ncbi:MAG TPA: hypothetical protein VK619_11650 [Pyrinomonadaceae bacterium]|nr:hypothetical protein [Pyrinomonadaceae bacterium]